MEFLYFLLIGAIVGWLAGKLSKGGGFGIIGNIVVGVLGAIIGGWLFGILGLSSDGSLIGSMLTALVGALLLLFVLGKVKK